ncbi:MAG: zinc ribbon domain-containing protein [Candidatus Lokiarchaeota archaeon]|nr:zinc ribbon domain-containing protein [Candidatus Lokiarchaeota archaeon]
MSLTIDALLKSQGEVHIQNVEIHWYFTLQSDEEEAIEIHGIYNIDSFYDSFTTEIQNARTQTTGFYEIFDKLLFTHAETQSTFIIGINHITEYDLSDNTLTIEFIFHRSIPQVAFELEFPVIASVAEIKDSNENLIMLESLIHKNLHIHFSDHVFKIPRCNRCSSALTLHNQVDIEEEVINEDFICMDCYIAINNFYNILENEVFKIADPSTIKEQRDYLVKFIIAGKKNASQFEEIQLQHFYNLLIIYVEYMSDNLDREGVKQKIESIITIGMTHNFSKLREGAENLMTKLNLEAIEIPTHQEPEFGESQIFSSQQPNSEPLPPPVPLGTPSPSTIIPQDPELTEGLQSLEFVQEELRSTLEALSKIESDLIPKPITPIDKMKALNTDLEDFESIPTFDDIKETFSDLESLDFPDIQFGIDSNQENIDDESIPEEIQRKIAALDELSVPNDEILELNTSNTINPTLDTSSEYKDEFGDESSFQMPTIQELPEQKDHLLDSDYTEAQDLEFPSSENEQLSPAWRAIPDTINPPPRMNPPPPVVTPPPRMNPPPPVVTPPPRMNPPPSVTPPSLQLDSSQPSVVQVPELKKNTLMGSIEPKIIPKPSFFNSSNHTHAHSSAKVVKNSENIVKSQDVPKPKEKRIVKRDRRGKHRKIICSFCGATLSENEKNCPNCGSVIKK